MFPAEELSPAAREFLELEHALADGKCPHCMFRISNSVLWWAHIDEDHKFSAYRQRYVAFLVSH